MSFGEVFANTFFDMWMVRDGFNSAASRGWGHLSTEAAKATTREHVDSCMNADQRFKTEHRSDYDTIRPAAARKLRSEASELLRKNKFCQTVVKLKIPKISRNYSGNVEKKYLDEYKKVQDGLTFIENELKIHLQKIDARHPASKGQAIYQKLLNLGSKIQRTGYEHRVSSGILFAATFLSSWIGNS